MSCFTDSILLLFSLLFSSLLSLGGVSSPALGLDGSFVFPLGTGLDPAPAGSLSLEVRAWVWDQGSAVLGTGLSPSLPTLSMRDWQCQLRMWPWGCQEGPAVDVSSSWGVSSPSSTVLLVGRGSADPLQSLWFPGSLRRDVQDPT